MVEVMVEEYMVKCEYERIGRKWLISSPIITWLSTD